MTEALKTTRDLRDAVPIATTAACHRRIIDELSIQVGGRRKDAYGNRSYGGPTDRARPALLRTGGTVYWRTV